jgi:hypothetical protein
MGVRGVWGSAFVVVLIHHCIFDIARRSGFRLVNAKLERIVLQKN